MTQTGLILAFVAVGIALGLVLLVAAVRSRGGAVDGSDERIGRYTALGMSIGMLFGAALGAVVWISTGEFVFWVVFLGGGMTAGMGLGRAMAERSR